MYNNNRISARQIKRLIIVEILAVSSLTSTEIAVKYSRYDGIFAILIAGILSYVYTICVLWICKHTKWNFWEYTEKNYGKLCSRCIGILFIIKYFILTIMTAAYFTKLIKSEVLGEMNYIGIFIPVLLLSLYGASKGIETRGRLAECIYVIFMLPIVFLIIFAFSRIDIYYLAPLFTEGIGTTFKGAIILFLLFSPVEILLFENSNIVVENDNEYKNIKKSIISGIITVTVVNILIFILNVGNLGLNTIQEENISTVKLMDMVNISGLILEKQGGLYLVFFIMAIIITLTGLLGNIFNILDKICVKESKNILKYLVVLLITGFGTFAFINNADGYKTVIADMEKRVEIDSREYVDAIFIGVSDGNYQFLITFNNGQDEVDIREYSVENIYSLDEIYRKTSEKVIDFSNVQAIIISTDVYRNYQTFGKIMEMINSEGELSDNVNMYATDEPFDRFKNIDKIKLPGKYMRNMTEENLEYGKTTISDIRKTMNGTEENALVSVFNVTDEEICQDGMVIMSENGFKGKYNGDVADCIWLISGNKGMYISFENGTDDKEINENKYDDIVKNVYGTNNYRVDKNSYYVKVKEKSDGYIEVNISYSGKISVIGKSVLDEEEINELLRVEIYNRLNILLEEEKCDLINIFKYLGVTDRNAYKKYAENHYKLYEKVRFIINTDYEIM